METATSRFKQWCGGLSECDCAPPATNQPLSFGTSSDLWYCLPWPPNKAGAFNYALKEELQVLSPFLLHPCSNGEKGEETAAGVRFCTVPLSTRGTGLQVVESAAGIASLRLGSCSQVTQPVMTIR